VHIASRWWPPREVGCADRDRLAGVKAFVVTGPHQGGVEEVAAPRAEPGQVVVDVERVGVCGTDVEFFTGEMAYLHQRHASYPLRLGHEWCGIVSSVGEGVDTGWIGKRVTGDTMIGCGRCPRCAGHKHHVCEDRFEIGIRGGWPGALADQLAVPAASILALPDAIGPLVGAMVEPAGNSFRAAKAADLTHGQRLLVLGPGTIGLLAAQFARSMGAEVHVAGIDTASLAFARTLDLDGVWHVDDVPALAFDAVIDATNSADAPARCIEIVEPAGVVVFIGLAGVPSTIDTRILALKDLRVVGILGGSAGLAGAIAAFADGTVDPAPLVSATVGLAEVGQVLGGWRPPGAGPGPKMHIDPTIH
jgi:threonine dehydrogenase-like Zn-dependent dehydrogenase